MRLMLCLCILLSCVCFGDMDTEQLSGLRKLWAMARTEEPVIADCDEPVRPHVLQEPTHALRGRHGTARRLPWGRCLLLARHFALFQGQDTVVAYGHPENVWGQIWQGFSTPADGRTMHNPILVPGVWRDKSEQNGLVQCRAELGPGHHGERLHGDKEGCA